MRKLTTLIAIALAALLLASGCGGEGEDEEATPSHTPTEAAPEPTATPTEVAPEQLSAGPRRSDSRERGKMLK